MPPIIPGTKWSAKGIVTTLTGAEEFLFRLGGANNRIIGSDMGVGGFISKTYAQAATLKSNSTLVKGALYFISDRFIYLRALNNNEFALEGQLKARNADYQAVGDYSGVAAFGAQLGIWYSTLTVNQIGDVVIWNNLHWRSLNGVVGTAPDGDAVNWVVLSIVSTNGYIMNEIDFVEFSFSDNLIQRRIDKRGNEYILAPAFVMYSIGNFQWGSTQCMNNKIFDAGANTMNFRGLFQGNTMFAASEFENVKGTNTSQVIGNIFEPAGILKDSIFNNTSFFNFNTIYQLVTVSNKTINAAITILNNTFGWNWTDAISISANIIKEFDGIFYHRKVSLSAAQIKTGNSIPIDSGIPLPGAGKAIEVVSASTNYTFGTVAFDFGFGGLVRLKTETANENQMIDETIIGATSSFAKLSFTGGGGIQLIANKKLMITADADSATGDGTANIYITAKIIEL